MYAIEQRLSGDHKSLTPRRAYAHTVTSLHQFHPTFPFLRVLCGENKFSAEKAAQSESIVDNQRSSGESNVAPWRILGGAEVNPAESKPKSW